MQALGERGVLVSLTGYPRGPGGAPGTGCDCQYFFFWFSVAVRERSIHFWTRGKAAFRNLGRVTWLSVARQAEWCRAG